MSTLETIQPETSATTVDPTPVSVPSEADWLVKVDGVRKKYCRDLRRSLWYALRDVGDALLMRSPDSDKLREFEFWAVDNVSFELRRGDSLGLLGRNGAGKSTLLKMIAGRRSLSAGSVTTRGRMIALTELGLGFNLALTGRENAYVNAAVHGISRKDFDAIIEDIIDFSGIREFIDSSVQTYSSGMRARLGFSVATHLNPDILVVDEILAVGDLEFRRKCVKHVLKYIRNGGSIILVAHDPYLVQSICNRSIVLDRGRVVFDGSGIDGVNFHFELGRSKEFSKLSGTIEGADSSLGDVVAEAEAEAAALRDLEGLPRTPRRALTPLTPEQPIIVDDMQVISADGGPLLQGKPAKVLMHYRALYPADITWGFSICTADLHISVASCVRGLDGDPSHVEPGPGTLTAILPDFPIQPGVYAVRGGIGDAGSFSAISIKGYQDSPHFFTVATGDVSRTANYRVLRGDLVTFEVQWIS